MTDQPDPPGRPAQPAPADNPPSTSSRAARRSLAGWVRRHLLATLVGSAVAGVAMGQVYVSLADVGEQTQAGVNSDAGGELRLAVEFAPDERGEPVEMSGTTLTGGSLSLSSSRGRVVVINVWGSWCPPCREEAPILAKASRTYAGRVDFVGVNVRDNRASAQAFERRYGIEYPSIEDTDGRAVLALNQYVPANAVPATLVLDRQGRVAARVLGAVRDATLRALLKPVLAEPAGR